MNHTLPVNEFIELIIVSSLRFLIRTWTSESHKDKEFLDRLKKRNFTNLLQAERKAENLKKVKGRRENSAAGGTGGPMILQTFGPTFELFNMNKHRRTTTQAEYMNANATLAYS
jgi:hypothetical protein